MLRIYVINRLLILFYMLGKVLPVCDMDLSQFYERSTSLLRILSLATLLILLSILDSFRIIVSNTYRIRYMYSICALFTKANETFYEFGE